jgi:ABC-type transport system involved in multi-copper enzyme maturation permease subunit
MTTLSVAPAQAPTLRANLPAAKGRAGFAGALRSEFTKITSLRSTMATLLGIMVVTIGLSTLVAWGVSTQITSQLDHPTGRQPFDPSTFDAVQSSMFGLIFGQLVIAVIGAMVVTGEYGNGMIRTSLTAQPRRMVTLAAKLCVFTAVALVTGLISSFSSYFIGQRFYSGVGLNVGLGDSNVLRAVIGGGLMLAVAGLLAFGLGLILRHTAGAITSAVGVLFVSVILFQFIPSNWGAHIERWVPFFAGSAIWSRTVQDPTLMWSAWAEFGVFAGYAALAIAVGTFLFKKRDA